MTKLRLLVIVLGTSLLVSSVAIGQTAPNSGDIFEEVEDVPIDGAIALLTLTGLGVGIRKLYRKKVN